MSEAPRRGDLRLSIPADAAFIAVARDVAARFAEYAGAAAGTAAELGRRVERMAARMSGASIDFAMEPRDQVLTVRATSGAAAEETTCPLPE
jgi:hypothetical protein